jgi:SAM-dependent methyltransferase
MPAHLRSLHLSLFKHGEFEYLHHDLFGYILEMSTDVLAFLDFFDSPRTDEEAHSHFDGRFPPEDVTQFLNVFQEYGCLVPAGRPETDTLWSRFPVKSRWLVWRLADDGTLTLYWSDGATAWSRALEPWQAALLDALDGNTQLSVAYLNVRKTDPRPEDELRAAVLEFMGFLTHADRQMLKLSEFPMSFYDKQHHPTPPYLISFLPYRRVGDLRQRPEPDAVRERLRRSLVHLLREPTPLLGGRSWGTALQEFFEFQHLMTPPPLKVLDLSLDLGEGLKDLVPHLPPQAEVTVLVRDAVDQAAYRQALGEHAGRLRFLEGTPQALPALGGPYDMVLALEVLGQLEHVPVEGEKLPPELERMRDTYGVLQGDRPEKSLFNLGAVRLLESLEACLAPEGRVVLLDWGEEFRHPTLATGSEVPHYLVHFGELKAVARKLGFGFRYGFFIDLMPFERDSMVLSSNRHHFTALQAAMADAGRPIQEKPYTPEEFAALQGPAHVGNVFFEKAEDRCFGVVPHQAKLVVLRR